MDINSLIYFTEAAKDLNFTKTAQRLFISQQNLSNHISRLETHYGVELFERKPRLALTYAGEVLLAYANNFRMSEDNLKSVLSDIKEKEKGTLHIGGSPSRSSIILPALAEQFSQKYPNIELHFYHHHSDTLSKMMLDGELDFSIGIDKVNNPNLISKPLFKDSIYLMVSDQLLRRHYPDNADSLIETSANGCRIRDFIELPFVNIRLTNILRDCFRDADCEPKFIVTSNYPQFFLPHYYKNVAASIITRVSYLNIRDYLTEDIHIFPIITGSRFSINDISFIRHKRKYLSQYGQYFLHLAEEYFQQLSSM